MFVADYIDKNILCQAYIHVQLPAHPDDTELSGIRDRLKQYAELRGKFFIYPEISVDVEFKEGSLKSYLTIAGALYIAIGQYGSFRSGVDFLYTDIKRLSEAMVAESLFVTKSRNENILRTESRVGIIGSLKNLVDDIEELEILRGKVSVDEIARRLSKLKEDSEILIQNLRDAKDVEELEKELNLFSDNLPDECPYPQDKKPSDASVIEYSDALVNFRKRFGTKKQKPH